jgi:hypothetical protein
MFFSCALSAASCAPRCTAAARNSAPRVASTTPAYPSHAALIAPCVASWSRTAAARRAAFAALNAASAPGLNPTSSAARSSRAASPPATFADSSSTWLSVLCFTSAHVRQVGAAQAVQ